MFQWDQARYSLVRPVDELASTLNAVRKLPATGPARSPRGGALFGAAARVSHGTWCVSTADDYKVGGRLETDRRRVLGQRARDAQAAAGSQVRLLVCRLLHVAFTRGCCSASGRISFSESSVSNMLGSKSVKKTTGGLDLDDLIVHTDSLTTVSVTLPTYALRCTAPPRSCDVAADLSVPAGRYAAATRRCSCPRTSGTRAGWCGWATRTTRRRGSAARPPSRAPPGAPARVCRSR